MTVRSGADPIHVPNLHLSRAPVALATARVVGLARVGVPLVAVRVVALAQRTVVPERQVGAEKWPKIPEQGKLLKFSCS